MSSMSPPPPPRRDGELRKAPIKPPQLPGINKRKPVDRGTTTPNLESLGAVSGGLVADAISPTSCELCSKLEISGKCFTCNKDICGNCLHIHGQIPNCKGHKVVVFAVPGSGEEISIQDIKCIEHVDRNISACCNSCYVPICNLCTKHNHKQHDWEPITDSSVGLLRKLCFRKAQLLLQPMERVNQCREQIAEETKRYKENTVKTKLENNIKLRGLLTAVIEKDSEDYKTSSSLFYNESLLGFLRELTLVHEQLDQSVAELTSVAAKVDAATLATLLTKHKWDTAAINTLTFRTSKVVDTIELEDEANRSFCWIKEDIHQTLLEGLNLKQNITNKSEEVFPIVWQATPKRMIDLSMLFESHQYYFVDTLYMGQLLAVCNTANTLVEIDLKGCVTKISVGQKNMNYAKTSYICAIFGDICANISDEYVVFFHLYNAKESNTGFPYKSEKQYTVLGITGVEEEQIVVICEGNAKSLKTRIKLLTWSKLKNSKPEECVNVFPLRMTWEKNSTFNFNIHAGPKETVFCSAGNTIFKYDFKGNLLQKYDFGKTESNLRKFAVDPWGFVYAISSSELKCYNTKGKQVDGKPLDLPYGRVELLNVYVHKNELILITNDRSLYGAPNQISIFSSISE